MRGTAAGPREPALQALDVVATRLGRALAILAGVTFVLLAFGATVRVHGAGLACPDWPLCFGVAVPEFDLRVALEWGHRLLAGCVSVAFLLVAGAVLARAELRARAGRWVFASAAVLAAQVVLGGLTVLKLLATWSVTLHLVFGNLFLLSLLAIRARVLDCAAPAAPVARAPVVLLAIAVGLQLVLGGLTSSSYAGLACTEWPACLAGAWLPALDGNVGLHLAHRWFAWAVLAAAAACAWTMRADAHARRPLLVAGLVLAQIALGVANVLLALPVELAVLHSATADAIVIATAVTAHGVLSREAR